MHDIKQTLVQSKRLSIIGRQCLEEIKKLLRQTEKIIQQSRATILNSKTNTS